MIDPRYLTTYADRYEGPNFYSQLKSSGIQNSNSKPKFLLPASVNEKWCEPGYQPKRLDAGYALTVNDYPFHPIKYGGSNWPYVVHTPFIEDN
jgi:hypothetical protein